MGNLSSFSIRFTPKLMSNCQITYFKKYASLFGPTLKDCPQSASLGNASKFLRETSASKKKAAKGRETSFPRFSSALTHQGQSPRFNVDGNGLVGIPFPETPLSGGLFLESPETFRA